MTDEVKYTIRHNITPLYKNKAIELYKNGLSAQEIKGILELETSVRQIQRWMVKAGVIRTVGDAFRNAITRGRVDFYFKKVDDWKKKRRRDLAPKLRLEILSRDNFTCQTCGHGVKDGTPIEIDHIDEDPSNNDPANLQVLCHDCNVGKSLMARFPSKPLEQLIAEKTS